MDTAAVGKRVEEFIRRQELIPPGGEVTCLVSGGADSTCLWHVLRELGYGVSALHVNHGLRGAESEEDARFCADVLGAEVVDGAGGATEEEFVEYALAELTDSGDDVDSYGQAMPFWQSYRGLKRWADKRARLSQGS